MTSTLLDSDEQQVVERVEQLLRDNDPKKTDPTTFLGAQYDLGLAWVHFPEGYGGVGVGPQMQKTSNERIFGGGGAPPHQPHPDRPAPGGAPPRPPPRPKNKKPPPPAPFPG